MPKSNNTEVVENNNDDVKFVSVDDFDVDKLVVPAIDDKRSSDTHYHSYPVYQYGKSDKSLDKLVLTTGEIKLTKGGIPKIDGKWRKTDADPARSTCWVGEDKTQQELEKFFNVCRAIDEKFDKLITYDSDEKKDSNLESKTVYVNKDSKKEPLTCLDYTPLVRLSQQGGEGEVKPDQKEYVPYERVKLRFAKKYDKERKEGEPQELTTVLFLGDKEEEEDLKFPSDFEKYLRWNCTAKFVLQLSKFRVKKAIEKDKKGKNLPRECAFDFNIVQIIITKEAPASGMSNADKYRKRFFPPTMKSTSNAEVEEKQKTKDESSDESSSEEEQETKSKVKSTNDAKSTKDSKSTKPKAKSESEESDSDSESEKKTKKSDKNSKKNTKKVDSESEESEESEDSEDSEDKSSSESEKEKQKSKAKKSSR
jgi:hypothetical protein